MPHCRVLSFTLHAAGPYRKGQQNVSDLYVSSDTPTLNALLRARRPSPANPATQRKRFIAIGQANASGTDKLPFVSPELAGIGRLVDRLTTFERIEGPESSISRVADELGKHEWVHFACHGVLNWKQPFESAFALHDGRFTIQRIIQCELENPEFAYLSACYTTVGDEESQDEAIHLASAMQFAGFRSVIGIWAVNDAHFKVLSVLVVIIRRRPKPDTPLLMRTFTFQSAFAVKPGSFPYVRSGDPGNASGSANATDEQTPLSARVDRVVL